MKIGKRNIIILSVVAIILLLFFSFYIGVFKVSFLPFGRVKEKGSISIYVFSEKGGKIFLNGTEIRRIYLIFTGKKIVRAYMNAQPDPQYRFSKWIINGSHAILDVSIALDIRGNTTIAAYFEKVEQKEYSISIDSNSTIYSVILNGSHITLPFAIKYNRSVYLKVDAEDIRTDSYKYRFLYWMYNGSKVFKRTLLVNVSEQNISLKVFYSKVRLGKYTLRAYSPFNNTISINGTLVNFKEVKIVDEEPYTVFISFNKTIVLSSNLVLYLKGVKMFYGDKLVKIFESSPIPLNINKNITLKAEYTAEKSRKDIFNVQIIVDGKTISTYMRKFPRQKYFNATVGLEEGYIKIEGTGAFHLRLVPRWKEIRVSIIRNSSAELRVELVLENGPDYRTKGIVVSPLIGSSESFSITFHNNPLIVEVKGTIYEESKRSISNTSFPGVVAFETILINVKDGLVKIKVEVLRG